MEENFKLLFDRIIDTLETTDLIKIKNQLENIKGNTVFVGSGGSKVVATFASKILNGSNVKSSRDLNYMGLNNIDNIMIFSYSGIGYTIENLLKNNKKIYLFTNGNREYENVENIKYNSSLKSEHSFISLASTLMPMTILYNYYKNLEINHLKLILNDMFEKAKNINIESNNVYEILTGYDTLTASTYLESTMVESGIAVPIIHDKYDYCHGRTTTSYKSHNGLIYYENTKELDKLLLENLSKYYTEIIKIEKYYSDDFVIDNDYYATIKSMYLTKKLAENKQIDLSKIEYSPLVKKLYYFKGEM
mgnify:CR=1 FL=1